MKLTTKEKSELIIEGIVTAVLLLLLNLSIIVLLDMVIATNEGATRSIFNISNFVTWGQSSVSLVTWQNLFVLLMLAADLVVIYWRLIRRYRQMQLRHVISELHYIADGHFDYQIPFKLSGDLEKVIDSINALVESTVEAMEDERQIEQSKDELITNVSHDIRTPLTSVIGYLGLIEDKQYKNEEELLKYAHIAYMKARQMKTLVEALFEYTKVRQTSTPLNLTTFDMVQMLEQIAASFEFEANKKKMSLIVKTRPDVIMMEADTEKLERVFNNLISNAFKYGLGGKHIFLEAKIKVDEVIVKVSNDGEPIPQRSLVQLFERFYRGDPSRSQETVGSGLGLAITQSIILLHSGTIKVTSDENLTSFIIHLPLKQPVKIEVS